MNSKKISNSCIRIFNDHKQKKELLSLMEFRFNNYKILFNYLETKIKKLKKPLTYKTLLEYLDISNKFDKKFFINTKNKKK